MHSVLNEDNKIQDVVVNVKSPLHSRMCDVDDNTSNKENENNNIVQHKHGLRVYNRNSKRQRVVDYDLDNNVIIPLSIATTIRDIVSVEDIFFNILSFFFHKSENQDTNHLNKNDVQSFQSIMCVSKQWYNVSTSTSFWSMISKHCVYIGNNKNQYGSHRNNGNVTIEQLLIGYTKIKRIYLPQNQRNDNERQDNFEYQLYQVKERATNEYYMLKVYTKNDNTTAVYSQCHLRQIYALQRVNYYERCNNLQSCHQRYRSTNLSLMIDWDVVTVATDNDNESNCNTDDHNRSKGKNHITKLLQLYQFHDYPDSKADTNSLSTSTVPLKSKIITTTLESFVTDSEDFRKGGLDLIRDLFYQITKGVIELHQCGIMHRNLNCKSITVSYVPFSNYDSSQKQDEEKTNKRYSVKIIHLTQCRTYSSSLRLEYPKNDNETSENMSNDAFAIYNIFEYMLDEMMKYQEIDCKDANHLNYVIARRCKYNKSLSMNILRHPFFNNTSSKTCHHNRDTTKVICWESEYCSDDDDENIKHRFEILKQNELKRMQHGINKRTWIKIVDWLFEIISVFEKKSLTVYMAMQYFDIYLSDTKVLNEDELQLIAATCLYLASKLVDDKPFSLFQLHLCGDRTYTNEEILYFETKILNSIHWYLSTPTIHDFVSIYLESTREMNRKCFWLSHCLAEYALQLSLCLNYSPSTIAASAVALSRYAIYNNKSFPEDLSKLTGYSIMSIGPCIIDLSTSLGQQSSIFYAIWNRYNKTSRCHAISKIGDLSVRVDLEKMK